MPQYESSEYYDERKGARYPDQLHVPVPHAAGVTRFLQVAVPNTPVTSRLNNDPEVKQLDKFLAWLDRQAYSLSKADGYPKSPLQVDLGDTEDRIEIIGLYLGIDVEAAEQEKRALREAIERAVEEAF